MAKYSTFHWGDGTQYGASATGAGEVSWIFQVDWDGDGTLDGTNEATYMVDLSLDRGERHYVSRSGEFETPQEGRFAAIMENSSGRYDPYNTSGALYGNIKPGRICQLRVMINATAVEHTVFTGRILDIRPESGTSKVRIEVVDGWGRLKGAKVGIENALINQGVSSCILQMLLDAEVPAYPNYTINSDTQPVRVFSVKDEDSGRVLADLAQSALGYFFFDRYNRPTFYPRNYNSMTTHTIDQSQVHTEIMVSQPWDLIGNHVTVIAHRIVKERRTSIWSLADPIYIAAGGTKTITATYDPSVQHSITRKAFVNINGTGRELTGSFALSYPSGMFGTSSITITITNNSASNGYLTELIIYARRLADRPLEYISEDTSSQAEYGVRFFRHDKPYLQSRNYAESFASTIEAFLDDVNREVVIRIEQRPTVQYPLELHDKVTFTSAQLGISGTYYIIGLHTDWMADTGQAAMTTVYLSPIIYDTTSITAEPIDTEQPIPSVPPSEPPEEPAGDGDETDDGGVDPLPGQAVAVAAGSGIYVSDDFGETSPTWTSKGWTGSGLVDFDVSIDKNKAIAITSTNIYKCDDLLNMASSTWDDVYDVSTLGTAGALLRVHWSPVSASTAWVLAACEGASSSIADAYMLKTTDGGATWAANLIKANAGAMREYTMDVFPYSHSANSEGNHYFTVDVPYTDRRAEEPRPVAIGVVCTSPATAPTGVAFNDEDANSLNLGSSGIDTPPYFFETDIDAGDLTLVASWLDDYFGSGNYDLNYIAWSIRNGKTYMRFMWQSGAEPTSRAGNAYALWKTPSVDLPFAMDVASNGTWLYVGFENVICKSEDGGINWFDVTAEDGAYDVHVDPQLAGLVYFLSNDGIMRYLLVNTTATIPGLSETALKIPLRIARSNNGGELWVAANGNINRRWMGAWSVQDTYTGTPRSLRAYIGGTGQRLVYLDGDTVQYSGDAGTTWSNKTGDLSITSSRTIHLLE